MAAFRIIGPLTLKINAENTEKIDFYVDDEYQTTDEVYPFEWKKRLSHGLHTIEIIAYDADGDISKELVDVYVLF